ncbi:MAG: hypothetical protein IRZ21_08745 [Thermoleophilaceae bacterium]|nr:hypothetical protein [Thermoleophilaceae bacterium]
MPRNDPTDTGGLFIGRRPGTAPIRYRGTPVRARGARRALDSALAAAILVTETLLCVTLWGPQPLGWLWVGSHVDYATGSVTLGIVSAFVGMLATLFLTLALAKRLDYVWKLVRRAAGHEQKRGALDRIFVVSIAIAGSAFAFWLFVVAGPGPQIAPRQ